MDFVLGDIDREMDCFVDLDPEVDCKGKGKEKEVPPDPWVTSDGVTETNNILKNHHYLIENSIYKQDRIV